MGQVIDISGQRLGFGTVGRYAGTQVGRQAAPLDGGGTRQTQSRLTRASSGRVARRNDATDGCILSCMMKLKSERRR